MISLGSAILRSYLLLTIIVLVLHNYQHDIGMYANANASDLSALHLR